MGTKGDTSGRRKKAKGEKHTKEFVETVLNSMDDAISIIDVRNFKIVGANQVFNDLYNLNGDEAIGRHCYEVTHQRINPCTSPDDICPLTETLKTGKFAVYDHIHTRPNGKKEFVEVSASPIKDDHGKVVQVVHIARNITHRKQSEQQIKNIIDAAPDVIHVISPDMKIITRNSASKKLFPHIKEGDYCHEALHKRDEVCTHCGVKKVFEDRKKHEHESKITLPDGNTIFVYSTSSPIFDESGNVISAVEILHDITKRKKTEEVLWKYTKDLENANNLKDLFTDIMRHDLLNHLGIIRNLAEIVIEENELDEQQDLQMMMSSALKLEEIVNAASAYAKLESAEHIERSEMDLNKIIKDAEEVLEPYFEEKNIKLEHMPEGKYQVTTISMLEEVFVNLLSNAIKYSEEDTKVVVDVEDLGENWRVTVADRGIGVPDEYKAKIFNRLTRRKKEGVKGSGIGLAIVKRIANLHGGATGVIDNPGGGSIFYFEIPKKQK